MTMRFAVNKSCSSAAAFLWEFYSFMTTASPSGPGWTSVGESNGTSGGMGTTGLFSSASDLTSSDAWFVLESPDTNRQILFERKVGDSASDGEMKLHYDRLAAYTGGSSTTLPTSSSSQAVYTSTTWISTSGGYYQFGADDASPYGWWFFGYDTTTERGCGAFVPIDYGPSGDVDPYLLFGNYTGFALTFMNGEGYGELDRTFKGWDPTGTYWGTASATFYYTANNISFPNGASLLSSVIGVPILFTGGSNSDRGLFKGLSNFIRWKGSGTAKDTVSSYSYVVSSDVVLDWDGSTTPT